MLAAGAFGRACDGNDVVDTHHQVGDDDRLDGSPQTVRPFDVAMLIVITGGQQLHADPHQEQGTHDLQEGDGQKREREEDQDHPQADGARGTVDDAQATLSFRKLAAGQCDHHCVVATQQDVDHDDLTDGDPEFRGGQGVHGGSAPNKGVNPSV